MPITGSLFVRGPTDHIRLGGDIFWAKTTPTDAINSNATRPERFRDCDLNFTKISILPLGYESI
jgi:hypothetical protein